MADFTVLQPCPIDADGETEDGQPVFNLPFDATSAVAIKAFTQGVKKDARAALHFPIRQGYDFGMQRFVFAAHIQAVDARSLPSFAQPNVNQSFRIRLAKAVASEPESDEERRLCQVWEAHVDPVGLPAGIQERPVIL